MSNQVTRIVLSKPAMTAAALRIPTIQPRKVITLNPNTSITEHVPAVSPAQQAPHQIISLRTIEKTSGLFDFDVVDPTVSTEIDKTDLDMENNVNLVDSFFTFDFESTPAPPLTPIISESSPKKAQKLNEANLSIKIVKPDPDESMLATPMNLDLDDIDLAHLLTPGTENICLQLLNSTPLDAVEQQPEPSSAHIVTGNQLLSSIGFTENELQTILNTSLSSASAVTDHVYSASASSSKRSISSVDDSDEGDENTTLDSSSPRLETTKKQKRTRGIYRAEDVTNQVELVNYLERRKKNNISSKISRANKKNYYLEMDAKSNTIANENKKLEVKITKLEKVNQIMKDFLKDAFLGNLK